MDDFVKKHGVFSWNELMTTDQEKAKAFYAGLFGWELEDMASECGGVYTVARVDGQEVAGIFTKPETVPAEVPPHWGSYVTVEDVDKAVEKAGELGGSVVVPPTIIPKVGRFAVVQDPQGAVVNIITYKMD